LCAYRAYISFNLNRAAEMATKGRKVPVGTRALIQRINRKLREDDQMIRATRGERARMDLGWYYVHDYRRNLALDTNVNLEQMGRELGVLHAFETWNAD
jgi:hypothetical protein